MSAQKTIRTNIFLPSNTMRRDNPTFYYCTNFTIIEVYKNKKLSFFLWSHTFS